jgi:hypothetical protein
MRSGLPTHWGNPFSFQTEDCRPAGRLRCVHYYEYDINHIAAERKKLTAELKKWADEEDNQAFGVKALIDRKAG